MIAYYYIFIYHFWYVHLGLNNIRELLILHDIVGQQSYIVSIGFVFIIDESMTIGKGGLTHIELPGPVVHLADEEISCWVPFPLPIVPEFFGCELILIILE